MSHRLTQKNTCTALVLLTALLLNFTFGAAHVAFHHDTEHGHHDTHEGHGHHNGPGYPTHTAQDHEPEMLLSRADLQVEADGGQAAVPFLAMVLEPEIQRLAWVVEIDHPRPPPRWDRPLGFLRGPPSLS